MTFKSDLNAAFRSQAQPKAFNALSGATGLSSLVPKDKRYKIENLFGFKRTRGDLILSIIMLGIALFLLWHFGDEGGWNDRDLPQSRVGKILKQQWVGPLMALAILVPSAVLNVWMSYRWTQKPERRHRPNRTMFEVVQWLRALEFLTYFIIYSYCVPVLGYLLSTLIFALFLTTRLGYRKPRWLAYSAGTAMLIVLVFRTFLQIKTPVNIWLYEQFPPALETFMKVYF
jgi:hypothetical protein